MRSTTPIALSLVLLLGAGGAGAQAESPPPGGDDDVTMKLITDVSATLPDAVTRQIVLPERASATALDKSAKGLAAANAAGSKDHPSASAGADDEAAEEGQNERDERGVLQPQGNAAGAVEQGLDQAAQAREDGRELGSATAAAARHRAEGLASVAASAAETARQEIGRRGSAGDLPNGPHPDLPPQVSFPDVPAPVQPARLGH